MLDIQFIRDNEELVKEKAAQKGYNIDITQLIGFDNERRKLLNEVDKIRRARNEQTDKSAGHKPNLQIIEEGKKLKESLVSNEHKLKAISLEFNKLLALVPNMPQDDVPVGASEDDNVISKEWGEKTKFDFKVLSHAQIGANKGWINNEQAAKVAGSRFVYLKGDIVLLEFALWQLALNLLTNEEIIKKIINDNDLQLNSKPFMPVLPPAVAKKSVYESTGRLNKEEQTYKIEGEDLWLNASAEHTMAPMYLNEIINESELPLRYVGYTTAFRREAGTYGKDMEGIFRLHQFNKMEMETFSVGESSLKEHFLMIAIQEYLMQQLGLPYQLITKCTADIGFPNVRGVDINVWLPSQEKYRETHTADYIGDFQGRSMKTRVRRQSNMIEIIHTNDATVLSERPLIGIIENYQTKEGNVKIPDVLLPYMNGKSLI